MKPWYTMPSSRGVVDSGSESKVLPISGGDELPAMMRSLVAVVGVGLSLLVCDVGLAQEAAEADAPVTIYSGVFTEEQAGRGKAAYSTNCSVCHGPTARGGPDAPGIVGYVFDRKYEGMPLSAYYGFMRAAMPPGRAGSLPAGTYADILAFLLSVHGATAGENELPADEALLDAIMIPERAQ